MVSWSLRRHTAPRIMGAGGTASTEVGDTLLRDPSQHLCELLHLLFQVRYFGRLLGISFA